MHHRKTLKRYILYSVTLNRVLKVMKHLPLRAAVTLLADDAGQALALPGRVAHEPDGIPRVAVAICKSTQFSYKIMYIISCCLLGLYTTAYHLLRS